MPYVRSRGDANVGHGGISFGDSLCFLLCCGILTNGQRCGKTIHTDREAVDAILQLLAGNPEKIKKECSESIERFSIDSYMSQIEELFDSVMA